MVENLMKVARVSCPCALAADIAMICIILKRMASLQQWEMKNHAINISDQTLRYTMPLKCLYL